MEVVEESDRKFQDFWREESEEFICGANVAKAMENRFQKVSRH